MDITLPEDANVDAYFKVDPHTGQLGRFDFDGTSGAVIDGNLVTLYLVDGGRGDADGLANGVIVDPGGPGTVAEIVGVICTGTEGLDGWTVVESGDSPTAAGNVIHAV